MTQIERFVLVCDRTACQTELPPMDTQRDAGILATELGWSIWPLTLCPPCRETARAGLTRMVERAEAAHVVNPHHAARVAVR